MGLAGLKEGFVGAVDGDLSKFPVARRTDSSGTVRIGYSHSGAGSVESLAANTKAATLEPLAGASGDDAVDFYWTRPASAAADVTALGTTTVVRLFDADSNTLLIGGGESTAPLIVRYDDNDQFAIGTDPTDMAGFEKALADDADNNDTVLVESYDPTDSSDVARFVLTVVADT